jgi:diguanylate cyclase (GGDEF)-like protein/PAS domain S-box-containing protein
MQAMEFIFEFAYTPYILPLLFAFGALTLVMAMTWRFRENPRGRAFLRLLYSLQIWALGFAVEMMAVNLSGKVFWANLQFAAILPLPLFWMEIALRFTGRAKSVKKYLTILSIPTVLAFIAIWTNDFHHLFRVEPYIDCHSGPFCFLVSDYGPVFYFHAAYSYLLFSANAALLARSIVVTKPLYKQQVVLLLIALWIPLATDILYVVGISPIPNYNFAPVTFSFAMIFVAIALFRFRMFNIRPLAYDMVVENLIDGVLILDGDNLIVDINPAMQRLLGLAQKQAIGEAIEKVLSPWPDLIEKFLDVSSTQSMIEIESGGKTLYFDIGISPISNRTGFRFGRVVTIRDVTERTRLLQEIEEQAITDSLTGLYNRRHFFRVFEQEISRSARSGESLSFLLLDLDHFKDINDTYGHLTGDYVLKEIAQILKNNLRNCDILVRYGGEEFVALLPGSNKESAVRTAERLRTQLSDHAFQFEGNEFYVTVSIGAAESDGAAPDALSSLIKAADAALYRAKSLGRNRVES